jgi:hypothetical protein
LAAKAVFECAIFLLFAPKHPFFDKIDIIFLWQCMGIQNGNLHILINPLSKKKPKNNAKKSLQLWLMKAVCHFLLGQ